MKTTIEMKQELNAVGIHLCKTFSGYYQALDSDGNLFWDDPACEDAYNEETAIYITYLLYTDNF